MKNAPRQRGANQCRVVGSNDGSARQVQTYCGARSHVKGSPKG